MNPDEAAIRDLVDRWMAATQAGDTAAVLELMTEDAVFLVPGRPPFGKREFAQAMQAQAGAAMRFDGRSEIEEIQVHGDWAFMRSHLTVTATAPGQAPVVRAGHTLSVLHRDGARWRLARDANLLVAVASP
ncbi:YybH family protein [Lysobacter yangpyeongensis]|uniref:YybH family protein n=1 Tax=Lysobacter yangpyeongensis TaxID=346182 RepID=A0ABW0SRA6_9GAMM